jgi:dTDP-4-dehydrorhamnose 3,5-epimerase
MAFQKILTGLDEVCIIKPTKIGDDRGFFSELYRKDQFLDIGLDLEVAQVNYSKSSQNILRGLHFQWSPPMGKLMRVVRGSAFLVAVNIRKKSPFLGEYFGKVCNEDDIEWIWAPYYYARGFCVLSESVEIEYFTSGVYNKEGESGIAWNDKQVNIQWPIESPILSAKDTHAQSLEDWLKTENSNLI